MIQKHVLNVLRFFSGHLSLSLRLLLTGPALLRAVFGMWDVKCLCKPFFRTAAAVCRESKPHAGP
jgi:hypothetical protein